MRDRHLKITKTAVENLPFSTTGQVIYRDTKQEGFGVLVGKRYKSYIVERKLKGRTVRKSLGRITEISAEQARTEAQHYRSLMGKGINPNEQDKLDRANKVSLQKVFDEFLKTRKNLKPRTIYDYKRIMDSYFKDWLEKPIVSLSKDMISRRHVKIGNENGEPQANGAMRVLRAVINFASGRYEDGKGKPLITENPVRRLSQTRAWYRVDRRRTLVKTHELPALFKSLDALKAGASNSKAEVVRDYILLLLLTGLRRQEGATLKWENVDFKEKTLTVPDTKNNEPHTLPLSNFLLELLKKRRQSRTNDFVFPGESKKGYLVEPKRQLTKVLEKSGLSFTLHDLRRTFITIAESLNISSYAVKRLLNHKMAGDVTAGYIILDVERLRKPMQQITDYILKNSKEVKEADVIELHPRK